MSNIVIIEVLVKILSVLENNSVNIWNKRDMEM